MVLISAQRSQEALFSILAPSDPPEVERRDDGCRKRQDSNARIERPKVHLAEVQGERRLDQAGRGCDVQGG
jgi:hypothetical protein